MAADPTHSGGEGGGKGRGLNGGIRADRGGRKTSTRALGQSGGLLSLGGVTEITDEAMNPNKSFYQ